MTDPKQRHFLHPHPHIEISQNGAILLSFHDSQKPTLKATFNGSRKPTSFVEFLKLSVIFRKTRRLL